MPQYTIPISNQDVEYSEDATMSSDSGSDCEFRETRSNNNKRPSTSSVQKPRKKAGRKSITASSDEDKKIARNRKAQRAFRERKEQYLHGLEEQIKEQATKIQELMKMNERLKRDLNLATTNKNQDLNSSISILSPTLSNSCMESHPDLCTRQDSPQSPNHDLLSSFLLQQQPPSSTTFSAASTLFHPMSPYIDDFNSLFCIANGSLLTPSSLLQPQEQAQSLAFDAYWNSLLAPSAPVAVKQEALPLREM
ncbi:UNVERIFIED_CONTAM: hypothetical protein HDU68_009723 [Siphonaria sp. JEL0065]|nr:hypothetical protein HDU68_009723 [Siphonaria sp. JEL0065]